MHGAAAQNKAGTDEHRVADLLCRFQAFGCGSDSKSFGLGDIQRFQELFKLIAVFRPIDRVAVCSDDLYAAGAERIGKVDRRLSAQRCDDAFGLFHLDHVHDILYAQRLKIQLV